jgi:hypothetical protein
MKYSFRLLPDIGAFSETLLGIENRSVGLTVASPPRMVQHEKKFVLRSSWHCSATRERIYNRVNRSKIFFGCVVSVGLNM